jgi:hypothetical protein
MVQAMASVIKAEEEEETLHLLEENGTVISHFNDDDDENGREDATHRRRQKSLHNNNDNSYSSKSPSSTGQTLLVAPPRRIFVSLLTFLGLLLLLLFYNMGFFLHEETDQIPADTQEKSDVFSNKITPVPTLMPTVVENKNATVAVTTTVSTTTDIPTAKNDADEQEINNNNLHGNVVDHENPSSPPPTPQPTSEPSLSPSPEWPYERVQQHAKESLQEMKALEQQLGDHFVPWISGVDDIQLDYHSLEQDTVAMLRRLHPNGLLLLGDSTTRQIYGFLWCLLEGKFRNITSEYEGLSACNRLQEQLKDQCSEREDNPGIDECQKRATFTNPDYADLRLEHRPHYDLQNYSGFAMEAVRDILNEKRGGGGVIYTGLPCLHSLWSPGGREIFVRPRYQEWPLLFDQLYHQMLEAAAAADAADTTPNATTTTATHTPTTAFLFGTSHTLCNARLGMEKQRIDMYLQGIPISSLPLEQQKQFRDGYDRPLPCENYTGVFPPLMDFRANHTTNGEDYNLYDDNGSMECSKIGMESFARVHSNVSVAPSAAFTYILDMRSATMDGCNHTWDGTHYQPPIQMKKAALILKGIARARAQP